MKRIWLVVLAAALLVSPVFAAQTQDKITDETLTTSSTVLWDDIDIQNAKRVSFFVTNDTTINGTTALGVTLSVTASISMDGINWKDISWFDVAGTTTPVTSEVLTIDTNYVGWMDNRLIGRYLRIGIKMTAPTEYGPSDSGAVTVTVTQDK